MASYDLLLFMLKLKPQHEEEIPCHSTFSEGIIRGLHRGSFAGQFGDHFRSGDHLQRCAYLNLFRKIDFYLVLQDKSSPYKSNFN